MTEGKDKFTEAALIDQPDIPLFHTRDLLLPKLMSGEVEVAGLKIETGGEEAT